MAKIEKRLDVLYVEWEDSSYKNGWHYAISEQAPARIRSVGIVVRRGAASVTLATSFDGDDGFLQQVQIPRSAIRKMRKVNC